MNFEATAKLIVQELLQPGNEDLVFHVKMLGSGSSEKSFMEGFATPHVAETLDYDSFAYVTRQLDVLTDTDTIDMSASYDEYLEHLRIKKVNSPLNKSQSERFEEMIMKHDKGMSGAQYGFLCRVIQRMLLEVDSDSDNSIPTV